MTAILYYPSKSDICINDVLPSHVDIIESLKAIHRIRDYPRSSWVHNRIRILRAEVERAVYQGENATHPRRGLNALECVCVATRAGDHKCLTPAFLTDTFVALAMFTERQVLSREDNNDDADMHDVYVEMRKLAIVLAALRLAIGSYIRGLRNNPTVSIHGFPTPSYRSTPLDKKRRTYEVNPVFTVDPSDSFYDEGVSKPEVAVHAAEQIPVEELEPTPPAKQEFTASALRSIVRESSEEAATLIRKIQKLCTGAARLGATEQDVSNVIPEGTSEEVHEMLFAEFSRRGFTLGTDDDFHVVSLSW